MPLDRNSNSQASGVVYEIRVEGQLSEDWSAWFEGLTIKRETDPERDLVLTVITGPISDQPALHGILNKIRDLNLKLISINQKARQ